MVEKIEVRTTSGGFIEVTRCEEGVVWVDIKRGDGTTGISGRLDGFGPTDLAAALDPKLMTRDAAKDLREKYNQACKSSVVNADLAYQKDQIIKALEASQSHGAYQKLNDELAKVKAEVASLQGQVVGRGAALDAANRALDLWQKAARDRLAQVATWEKEALLRAGSHETLTAVAKVFACPTHDVVCKAASLLKRHAELCATVSDGEAYVAGETWKQRDARHRETIHQLKQENRNLRGKVEKLILDNADRARPRYIEVSPINPPVSPAEAAHVMSLTKQLEEARNDVKATQKEVYDLKLAGKICAEAMQEWRSKLTSECGFTYPNLVNLSDVVRRIREWKTRPAETPYLLNGEGERTIASLRAEVKAADAMTQEAAARNTTLRQEVDQLRGQVQHSKREHELCSGYLQQRTTEMQRYAARVKELEQRCFDIEAIATGRKP